MNVFVELGMTEIEKLKEQRAKLMRYIQSDICELVDSGAFTYGQAQTMLVFKDFFDILKEMEDE